MKRSLLSETYEKCDPSYTLTSVIGHMQKSNRSDVFCFTGNKFTGVVDPHLLLKIHTNKGAKISKAIRSVKKVSVSTSERQLITDFLDNNVHSLPVFDAKRKFIGVVHALDVVSSLLNGSVKKTKLSVLASVQPLYFYEDTPLVRALSLLRNHHVDHAPIVDRKLRLTGIVSLTDLLLRYYRFPQERVGGRNVRLPQSRIDKRKHSGGVSIGSIATGLVVTAGLNDTVGKAVSLMMKQGISSVVLTEADHLVGIVTITDILRLLQRR